MRVTVVIIAGLIGCGRIEFDSTPDATVSLDVGLVGHWAFEDGSGGLVADTSGNGNDGLLGGGFAFTAGRIGMALSLDGIDGRVNIQENTNVLDVGAQSFSYSVWVNASAPVGLYDSPWWRGGSSTFYPGYDFELGVPPWRASLSDGNTLLLGTFNEVLDQWVLLTAVVDRDLGALTLYQDASIVDTQPMTLGSLASARAAQIGDITGGTSPFHGLIDDMRVYNRALAAAEVDALYRQ
jgi:hypothetical protein